MVKRRTVMLDKRVKRLERQIKKGYKEEREEHPWAEPNAVDRIVKDHLRKHPFMYLERETKPRHNRW